VDPAPGRGPRQPGAAGPARRAGLAQRGLHLPRRPWERHFTVIQWDHRGAGKTLGRNGKAGSGPMTFDRRVADAIEVIEFLR
jgi:pimeloyl-ACP methyl ester carboxylesterase